MKRAAAIGAVGFVAAAALLVVPGATLGSFSDTEITPNNAIDATTLEISTGGGTGANKLDFSFDNLLPGVRQTASGTYRNVGRIA
jgi:predicted ribosomally synthesized peptide with SipW-like signal peptide